MHKLLGQGRGAVRRGGAALLARHRRAAAGARLCLDPPETVGAGRTAGRFRDPGPGGPRLPRPRQSLRHRKPRPDLGAGDRRTRYGNLGMRAVGLGPDPATGLVAPQVSRKEKAMGVHAAQGANTTIAIVATDAPLSKVQCHRMAVTAHDGMARAIVPSHTPLDGDLVFAAATGDGSGVDAAAMKDIGAAAAVCLSRAIARGVYAATAADGDIIGTWRDMS